MDAIQEITSENVNEFLDHVDTFLLDCDGVLWRGNTLIEGIPDVIEFLRRKNKRLIFVTNNSTKTRAQFTEKMAQLGIRATEEEIFGSAYATAAYLKSINFTKSTYIIGQSSIGEEFENMGLAYRGINEHATTVPLDKLIGDNIIKFDPMIGAVVVGLDTQVNYTKLAFANFHLLNNPDCLFLATNTDPTLPAEIVVPGAGSIVSMVECSSGRKAQVIGKPSQIFMQLVSEMYHLDKKRTCMVGDRLDTDIQFGIDGGLLNTLLVLTGSHQLSHLNDPKYSQSKPKFYIKSLSDLVYLSDKQQQ
eukprot:TRINITY_DN11156_c0_g1_i1.p1 TRINITY_DN11156_c0_g1~~TRINITY_DN11156_c0_g1_i1.p1  ORF type:complete len:304 (-),score=50.40 TRINITY_DN11156_c0_g1_i1:24-935(-)